MAATLKAGITTVRDAAEAHADSFRRAVAAGVQDGRLVDGHV